MAQTKTQRIEVINLKIVALMLKRSQFRRYRHSWDEEQAITTEILALEVKIKEIREE
jgi:hypothetical protein